MKYLNNILFRRPRLVDALHRLHLARPMSQTIEVELRALEKYAQGALVALEIGSYQGVSAVRIAAAMAEGGMLYCVDPWPTLNGRPNPCYSIFQRHVRRTGLNDRIRVVKALSSAAVELVPDDLDFVFVDGDHSWEAITKDWEIARERVKRGGIVCLHDALVPDVEPWRRPDSVRFFAEVVSKDGSFRLVHSAYSLAVLQKKE